MSIARWRAQREGTDGAIMHKRKILIVEDDPGIRTLVEHWALGEHYAVIAVGTGAEGLTAARAELPDVVLLDLMLPDMSGYQVCLQIKADTRTSHIAVIIVTVKGEEADVVIGLEVGADDYIVKPFSPRILMARIDSVLRRRSRTQQGRVGVLKFGAIVIDAARREVMIDTTRIELTATEFEILHFLASHPGYVFRRQRIAEAIHGEGVPETSRAVDVQIATLRKKLGCAGTRIETIRGAGYRFRD